MSTTYDVIIVGAGLAGLQCALTLKQEAPHLRILIVEARPVIGGRVYPQTTFSQDHPIELGAELVHGSNTLLYSLLRDAGLETTEVYTWAQGDSGPYPDHPVHGGCGYYYLGAENRMLSYDSQDPDFLKLNQTLRTMNTTTNPYTTVHQYLVAQGVAPRMMSLANAGYANTLCSTLSVLPQHQSAEVMHGFEGDGGEEWKCLRGYAPLLSYLRKDLEIWTSWAVSDIHWTRHKVTLTSETGERIYAKQVVLTVSVEVMKDRLIQFQPHLEPERMRIYKAIRMEACLKLALRFRRRFVPDDFRGMICADCPVPEFWSCSPPQDHKEFIMMGFATASFAQNLGYLSRSKLKITILNQLDRMWGTEKDPHPARDSYVDMVVQDWTREKYIRGGYSSPSFNVTKEERAYLASPLQQTVFFAGEAMCPTRYMVMHAALESGVKAARDIMTSVPIRSTL